MKLWTINKFLRKIGLVLTLFSGMDKDGYQFYAFTLERASTYDKRVKNATKVTENVSE